MNKKSQAHYCDMLISLANIEETEKIEVYGELVNKAEYINKLEKQKKELNAIDFKNIRK